MRLTLKNESKNIVLKFQSLTPYMHYPVTTNKTHILTTLSDWIKNVKTKIPCN